jgi:hypothetical protein
MYLYVLFLLALHLDPFSKPILKSLENLYRFLSLIKKENWTHVRILYSSRSLQTAVMIRGIAEAALTSSHHHDDFLNSWLSPESEATTDEMELVQIQGLNHYSALWSKRERVFFVHLVVLSQIPSMEQIMSLSREQFFHQFPLIEKWEIVWEGMRSHITIGRE